MSVLCSRATIGWIDQRTEEISKSEAYIFRCFRSRRIPKGEAVCLITSQENLHSTELRGVIGVPKNLLSMRMRNIENNLPKLAGDLGYSQQL